MKSSREYRKSAQALAVKAAMLLDGKSGLAPEQRLAALKMAVSMLANAMAHASAAVALAELKVPAPVDIPAVEITDEMLEAFLATETGEGK